jgi:hypothetical protein
MFDLPLHFGDVIVIVAPFAIPSLVVTHPLPRRPTTVNHDARWRVSPRGVCYTGSGSWPHTRIGIECGGDRVYRLSMRRLSTR